MAIKKTTIRCVDCKCKLMELDGTCGRHIKSVAYDLGWHRWKRGDQCPKCLDLAIARNLPQDSEGALGTDYR